MRKYKVLSTKKLDALLTEQAEKKGIALTERKFISVKSLWNKETADWLIDFAERDKICLVFTSSNAVEILVNHTVAENLCHIFNRNICCLSGKTKKAVSDSGFSDNVVCEADTAAGLAAKIIEREIDEVIFCCSNKRRDDLPDRLKEAGITVHEMIVYETVETPVTITGGFDAVLFFSPSAVGSFFSVNRLKEDTVCFTIGQTTANAIRNYTDNKIIVSSYPDPETMLDSVYSYFNNKNDLVS